MTLCLQLCLAQVRVHHEAVFRQCGQSRRSLSLKKEKNKNLHLYDSVFVDFVFILVLDEVQSGHNT